MTGDKMKWGDLRPGDMLLNRHDEQTYLLCYDTHVSHAEAFIGGERGWWSMDRSTFIVLPKNNMAHEIDDMWTVFRA